jgi:RIO-like serine/threonine protein kinase
LKISPLIYKLRTKEGTSIIVHINRLKRPYCKQLQEQKAGVKSRKQKSRKRESNVEPSALESCEDRLDVNIPSNNARLYRQTENIDIESSDETEQEELLETNFQSSERETQEWMPNSRYLQRKLLTETTT